MKTIGSKILISKPIVAERSQGGLYIPSTAAKATPVGVIMGCPEEYVDGGVLRKCPFKEGDKVRFLQAYAVKLDDKSDQGDDVFWVEIANVIGVVE